MRIEFLEVHFVKVSLKIYDRDSVGEHYSYFLSRFDCKMDDFLISCGPFEFLFYWTCDKGI